MAIRCKFVLHSRTHRMSSVYDPKTQKSTPREMQSFEFGVVTDGSDEDRGFFASTPVGRIELGLVNPEAVKELELSKSYYVTFTPVKE